MQVLPSGHEWYELDSGRRVTLITRCDYREGTTTREGTLITGDEVVTRQTAEAKCVASVDVEQRVWV